MTILDRNLEALANASPYAVEKIRAATPATLDLASTLDKGLAGIYAGRSLCSRCFPLAEADALAATIDVRDTAAVVVLGFGMGYHVAAMLRRMDRSGPVFVFEPDVPLLRAVLERVDCSDWIKARNLGLLTDPDDTGAISAMVNGCEGPLAMGVKFLESAADQARLGPLSARFRQAFVNVYRGLRTNVMTTLMQSGVTLGNTLKNLARYVTSLGVAPLKDRAKGRPAIVVSAGPSLMRNVELLKGERDRFVIIATQTVLKPLLRLGIVPHYVCALDWSDLCGRFYEGLTAKRVAGCHLVCMVDANPIIPSLWPGVLRMVGDSTADEVAGENLTGRLGTFPRSATVAQMCHQLGRYMGCDPIIYIGQDLGYTDGIYYGKGAAIHDTWACELNEFRTLEMFEWERIARNRAGTKKVSASGGGEVYSDAAMLTYLEGFKLLWRHDQAAGLKVIDATEGGVDKAPATVMPLYEAMDEYRPATDLRLNETPGFRIRSLAEVVAKDRLVDKAGQVR